jgi:hypothetical protein
MCLLREKLNYREKLGGIEVFAMYLGVSLENELDKLDQKMSQFITVALVRDASR